MAADLSRAQYKKLLRSNYRKEMWRNVNEIARKIKKALPIASMHLMGSFSSNKRRPADVDFIVMLKTPVKRKHARWSLDLVIAPDNKHGQELLEDNKKWMRQKYGYKNSEVIRYF